MQFEILQLPCRKRSQNTHSQIDEEKNKKCLIQISRYRFSLVISGLTKMLQRVNEMVPTVGGQRSFSTEQDRYCYESIVIVLDTLERCLVNQPKDTTKFEEAMNVKFLLWEICQFIGTVSFSSPKKYFILFNFCFVLVILLCLFLQICQMTVRKTLISKI